MMSSPTSKSCTPDKDDTITGFTDKIGIMTSTTVVGKNQLQDAYEVTLDADDDPKNMTSFRKWLAVFTISSAALCVTCTSSIAAATETGVAEEFHVSKTVTILGISLFVEGLGCGPLLLGPLSEFYGRNPVYLISYSLFWVFSWPVAFAPNIAIFLIFRFVSGFAGAAFLSVAGGSVSDMFCNATVANPMAVYTLSPFIGPILGPLISGFINQNVNWRWTYRVQLIWAFVEVIALILFVPETYVPAILKRKARRLRRYNNDPNIYAPLEVQEKGLLNAILVSCYKPFLIFGEFFNRFPEFLPVNWNALILGILYLAFQAFPIIFEQGHGFNVQTSGLTFLGIGIGMLLALASQPYWNRVYAQESLVHNGHPPPEVRLLMGMPGGVLVSLSLFWIAFTTYPHVHWIVPIIGSIPFGTAASAMAGNSALRSAFAAVFPLFAGQMFARLGTVGAMALLAGLTAVMAPLPFIFYKFGHKIRAKSRFAVV